MQNKMTMCFVGGGNMARALISGLLPGLDSASQIRVVDINQDNLTRLESEFGVQTSMSLTQEVCAADVIVLAVKPQQLRDVVGELQPFLQQQLIISIAAGIRSTDIARWLGGYAQIVRAMPNTPALIGKGITGMYALPQVTQQQKALAEHIMAAVGLSSWLAQEHDIDAVTAISGSGPAYVFYFIEALQRAAEDLGLSAEQSEQFAIATFEGAAQLALHADEHVSVLRERVTSKGGTTYAALHSMESNHVGDAIVAAVKAAAARAKGLGDEFGQQD